MAYADLQVIESEPDQRFDLFFAGRPVGHIDYDVDDGVLAFVHTEIDPRYRRRGFGCALVSRALDTVAARGGSVLPICWFVREYIVDHPEYAALVPAERRAEFRLAG
jgi:predicted GNAT family acetyltransferase